MQQDQPRAAVLRDLPQVQKLLEFAEAGALVARHSRPALLAALRAELEDWRRELLAGSAERFSLPAFFARVEARLEAERRPRLRPVINATGIVLHTNLGRAPIGERALEHLVRTARSYGNLEFDLEAGERGSRMRIVEELLCRLTGAEAALVVNNNAAAVLLTLAALAAGGEVVISRGELVEIGGAFRMPDIIRQGGAKLVEVGTTNRTRLEDYAAAITADTRILLKVHQSNYRIVGFTEAVPASALSALGRERNLLAVEDLGSGTLVDLTRYGLVHEPTVQEAVAAGLDIVTCSGDKLLGGPQAGLILGRREAVARLRRHPLLRALRIDKLCLAALEGSLLAYLDPEQATAEIPVLRMLAEPLPVLEARARRLAAGLQGVRAEVSVIESEGYAGGGAMPASALPSHAVSLGSEVHSAEAVARRLRLGDPAVVSRISENRVLLDLRTVADAEIEPLAAAIRTALA